MDIGCRIFIIGFLIWICSLVGIHAQSVEYTAADSICIEQLLKQAQREKPENVMMYFGKQFLGLIRVMHLHLVGTRIHLEVLLRLLRALVLAQKIEQSHARSVPQPFCPQVYTQNTGVTGLFRPFHLIGVLQRALAITRGIRIV